MKLVHAQPAAPLSPLQPLERHAVAVLREAMQHEPLQFDRVRYAACLCFAAASAAREDYGTARLALELARDLSFGPDGLDEAKASATHPSARRVLHVAADASSFAIDHGAAVSLRASPLLRELLIVLVEVRSRSDRWVSARELFGRLWPGSRLGEPALLRRLYVLVSRLRALGLSSCIASSGAHGWRITPGTELAEPWGEAGQTP